LEFAQRLVSSPGKTKWALLAAGLRWRPEPARAARRLRAS
jgi:hypothetical protein